MQDTCSLLLLLCQPQLLRMLALHVCTQRFQAVFLEFFLLSLHPLVQLFTLGHLACYPVVPSRCLAQAAFFPCQPLILCLPTPCNATSTCSHKFQLSACLHKLSPSPAPSPGAEFLFHHAEHLPCMCTRQAHCALAKCTNVAYSLRPQATCAINAC